MFLRSDRPAAGWAGPRILAVVLLVGLLSRPYSANGARFAILHHSFDGGGGAVAAGRFEAESSITPFSGSGHIALLNDAPLSEKDFFALPATGVFSINISDLLENDSDLEGNKPLLSLPGTGTKFGGSLIVSNGVIVYTPPADRDRRGDAFSYIVSDAFGSASMGRVILVDPAAAPRLVQLEQTGEGIRASFQGLANEEYMLQYRVAFEPREYWRDFPNPVQAPVQRADTDGLVQFIIPRQTENQFFRAVDLESLRRELAATRREGQLNLSLRGVPNAVYKLQFRPALEPPHEWQDYPGPNRPLLVRSGSDGIYQLAVPMFNAHGFFRTVPREP